MARFAISLLALLLIASYASATTLEELCKATYDADYCITLLKPTVTKSTDFNSVTWHKRVLSRALARALIAKKFVMALQNVPEPEADAWKSCVHSLHQSAKLLQQASAEYGTADVSEKLDQATANQEACSDALEDAGESMVEVKAHANEAATASKIAKYLI